MRDRSAYHSRMMTRASVRTAGETTAGRRGFTVTELMLAVAVLLVVILASARIFRTASQVASMGQATSDVLAETIAIDRQLRQDIKNLSREGFFAIRCVSVRNDINEATTGLLNPNLAPDARIRADQLVFFTNAVQGTQVYRANAGSHRKGQGTSARIYYGHGFQLPQARGVMNPTALDAQAFDAAVGAPPVNDPLNQMTPWSQGNVAMERVSYSSVAANDYASANDSSIAAAQPESRQWLLVRQPLVMVDDGDEPSVYLFNNRSGRTVFDREVINSRVDMINQSLNGDGAFMSIRQFITEAGNSVDQRDEIAAMLFYPRAQRQAPSGHRVDHALTTPVLSSACSSFRIEWTYAPGVGEAFDVSTDPVTVFPGVHESAADQNSVPPMTDTIWFGLPEFDDDGAQPDVFPYDQLSDGQAETIYAQNIEAYSAYPPNSGNNVEWYEAVFGFNQDKPFWNPEMDVPDRVYGTHDVDAGYTPWPTAIRITMTLHDPNTRLEAGREVQFVIALPRRDD